MCFKNCPIAGTYASRGCLTLQFLQHRATLFAWQPRKACWKEPLCSYSARITLTFAFAKQVHTEKSCVMCPKSKVCAIFFLSFRGGLYLRSFQGAWWNVSPLCCTSHLSSLWCYTAFWEIRNHIVDSVPGCSYTGGKQEVFSCREGSVLWLRRSNGSMREQRYFRHRILKQDWVLSEEKDAQR